MKVISDNSKGTSRHSVNVVKHMEDKFGREPRRGTL